MHYSSLTLLISLICPSPLFPSHTCVSLMFLGKCQTLFLTSRMFVVTITPAWNIPAPRYMDDLLTPFFQVFIQLSPVYFFLKKKNKKQKTAEHHPTYFSLLPYFIYFPLELIFSDTLYNVIYIIYFCLPLRKRSFIMAGIWMKLLFP